MAQEVEGRVEVIVKFYSIPEARIDEKAKTTTFRVASGKQFVSATVASKSWNKVVDQASKLESWVCSVQGKVGRIEGDTIHLIEAGAQIFEKPVKKTQIETKGLT